MNHSHFQPFVDALDLVLGGYSTQNGHFCLIVHTEQHPNQILQIINRNMQACTADPDGKFGLCLTLEFDLEDASDARLLKRVQKSAYFKTAIYDKDEAMHFVNLLLPNDSEKSAALLVRIFERLFDAKAHQKLVAQCYDVED